MPNRSIHNWRDQWDDDDELYTDTFAENLLARANAKAAVQSPSSLDDNMDSAIAQTEDSFAQYAQIRDKLMERAATLANNLMLGDVPPPGTRESESGGFWFSLSKPISGNAVYVLTSHRG